MPGTRYGARGGGRGFHGERSLRLDERSKLSIDERWTRAQLRYHVGQRDGAIADTEWLLEKKPDGIDLERVRELRRLLDRLER